jgi:hypothetical protein
LRQIRHLKYTQTLFGGGAMKGGDGGGKESRMRCARYTWLVLTCTIGCMAYLSPVIMVVLPKTLPALQTVHYQRYPVFTTTKIIYRRKSFG